MGLLQNQLFVCVDCESTGLDPDQDAIIEVGVVRFTLNEQLETLETLVNPGRLIPEESIAIHGITDKMVADSPKIDKVLPQVLPMLEQGIIVGHGVTFDLKLIEKAARDAGHKCNLSHRRHIDTLRLARLYGESPTNSLEVLRQHFQIPAEQAHRALDDAIVNMKVFFRLVERFRTTEQVFDALAKPVKLKKMPLGKHKGRPFSEVPLDYLRWAARQRFDQDLLYSIREELRRRKGGNAFRQASNPFQEL
jgi:DNA polymerase-3 subunit epsilon